MASQNDIVRNLAGPLQWSGTLTPERSTLNVLACLHRCQQRSLLSSKPAGRSLPERSCGDVQAVLPFVAPSATRLQSFGLWQEPPAGAGRLCCALGKGPAAARA